MTDLAAFADRVNQMGEYALYQFYASSGWVLSTEQTIIVETRIEALRAEAERVREEQNRIREEKRAAEEIARAEAKAAWDQDPLNVATRRGWDAMKKTVPGLDGVAEFTDLPPALQYRYGAFARAVLAADPADYVDIIVGGYYTLRTVDAAGKPIAYGEHVECDGEEDLRLRVPRVAPELREVKSQSQRLREQQSAGAF